jgi:phosphodiesterase/alkaline phosphatase D-like protein
MPRATVSTVPQHFDLTSCPGGFVELRRMTHGQRLHRQDIAMQMSMQADQRARTASMDVKPAQTRVAQYEFKTCIADHNLEDEAGRKLDFGNAADFDLLDGRIGEEISAHIDTLHDWEADLPNSEQKSIVPSSVITDVQTKQDGHETAK